MQIAYLKKAIYIALFASSTIGRGDFAQTTYLQAIPPQEHSSKKTIFYLNTSNPGKLAEYQEYLGTDHIEALAFDLQEPQADPLTIIQYKASQFDNVIVDDVALDVEGVDIGVNIRWLLQNLADPTYLGRRCTFHCLLGINSGGEVRVYRGAVDGTLTMPRGDGFGFGPYFLPTGTDKTLGEYMDPRFNARYIAIQNYKNDQPYAVLPVLKYWGGIFQ